jgi:hypothetical protein
MKTRMDPLNIFFKPLGWLFMLLISLKANTMETKFAVIGDFGEWCKQSIQVSELVKSWDPDFILSTGDNNCLENAAILTGALSDLCGQFYVEEGRAQKMLWLERGKEVLGN